MKIKSRLYHTIIEILNQHKKWLDKRHMYTLAWMVVGLIQSGKISLTSWIPFVESRASYAQSTQRRFSRWLKNSRINVNELYAPLIQRALLEWGDHILYLALDTSQLFGEYCLIRLSVVFRGRAVPIVWRVLKHPSSQVSLEAYKDLLGSAAELLPKDVKIVFLADRGFADTSLMKYVNKLEWHFRIRIKSSFLVYRNGKSYKVNRLPLCPGEAIFLKNIYLTAKKYGKVYLAAGYHASSGEKWYVVSDEPVSIETQR